MQKDYFATWFNALVNNSSWRWSKSVVTAGTCRLISGPKTMYASVKIKFDPHEIFEVVNLLNRDVMKVVELEGWYESIIFGVLDVMLTIPATPIRDFKMEIQEIDFNEIESTQVAFRIAARDAACKALKIQFPNMKLIPNSGG